MHGVLIVAICCLCVGLIGPCMGEGGDSIDVLFVAAVAITIG